MKHDQEKASQIEASLQDYFATEIIQAMFDYHEHMEGEQEESKAASAVWTFLDKVGYGGDLEADYVNFYVTGKELRQLMNAIKE